MTIGALLLKTYANTLYSVGALATVCFMSGLITITRFFKQADERDAMTQEMTAIAGDDVMATQLDLARAYLETGSEKLAKTILKTVAKAGSPAQRLEAKRLLRK